MKFPVRKILNGLISIKIYFIFFITLSFAFIFLTSVQNAHAAITFDGKDYNCNNARTAVVLKNGKEIPNIAGSQCERLQICDWTTESGQLGCISREDYCSKNDNCSNDSNNCRKYLGSGTTATCKSIVGTDKDLNNLCQGFFYCYSDEICYPKSRYNYYCSATPHAIPDGNYCNNTPECSTSSFCDTDIRKSNTCRPCKDVSGHCETGVVPSLPPSPACTDLIGLFGVTSAKCSTYTPAIDPNWHVITPEKYDCTGSDNCWIYTPSSKAPVDPPTPTPTTPPGVTVVVSPTLPYSTPIPLIVENRKGYCGKEDRITNMKEVNAPLPANCTKNNAKLDTSNVKSISPYCHSLPNGNQAPYFYECTTPPPGGPGALGPGLVIGNTKLICLGTTRIAIQADYTPGANEDHHDMVVWTDSVSNTPNVTYSQTQYSLSTPEMDGTHQILYDIYACPSPAGVLPHNPPTDPSPCLASQRGYFSVSGAEIKAKVTECAASAVPTATLTPSTGKLNPGDYAANGAVCNPARAQLACASSLDVCSIHWDCTGALASQAHGCCTTGRWCPSSNSCMSYGQICAACPVVTPTPTIATVPTATTAPTGGSCETAQTACSAAELADGSGSKCCNTNPKCRTDYPGTSCKALQGTTHGWCSSAPLC